MYSFAQNEHFIKYYPLFFSLGNIIGTQTRKSPRKSPRKIVREKALARRSLLQQSQSSQKKSQSSQKKKSTTFKSTTADVTSSEFRRELDDINLSQSGPPISQGSQGSQKKKKETSPTFHFKTENDKLQVLDWVLREGLVHLTRQSKYIIIFIIRICHFQCVFSCKIGCTLSK